MSPANQVSPKTSRRSASRSQIRQRADKHKSPRRVKLAIDKGALKKLKLIAVAYSYVEREWFPTEEAYEAEREVEYRAAQVVEELQKIGIDAKGYPGDQYFFTNLLVDKPDLVLNLVDTLRGKDSLQTSVPAALELANIPYTGAGMEGLVIGNDRNLFKQMFKANDIPTPDYQYITKPRTKIDEELGLPLIVKLNEGGGSVGIDNHAIKEKLEEAQEKVVEMIKTYRTPVIVERFIDGPEITAVIFDDGECKHVFLGKKKFGMKPDGKHSFTSLESYSNPRSYTYEMVDPELADQIEPLAIKAFTALHNRDYAKFDIRVDEQAKVPYFTDANPNTAFGPRPGLPLTEVLAMYDIKFETVLASLMSKYAKKME